jgi:hypothetical protein
MGRSFGSGNINSIKGEGVRSNYFICRYANRIMKLINIALKSEDRSWAQWLTPVIPGTWKVDIGKIVVSGQTGLKVSETPS